jgi:stage V sporulation protein D (sporulation-specific penicillin-binding protein)
MINPTAKPPAILTSTELTGLKSRVRFLMLVCLLGLLYAGIGLGTVHLRYAGRILSDESFNPYRTGAIPAPRGRILDRNGNVLVDNRIVSTLFVNPSRVNDAQREQLALALNENFGCDLETVRRALSQRSSTRKVLIPEMTDSDIDRFQNLPQSGDMGRLMMEVGVLWRENRSYPAGALAGPVLGYTGMREDGQAGLAGLEYLYDPVLSSRYGEYTDMRDQRGNRVPGTREEVVPPRYGSDLVLTLDADIQTLVKWILAQ